jgi:hypothetical protein
MNPTIMTVAENIEAHLDIKTACDYLNLAREPLNQTLFKIDFLDKCHEVDVNGKMFARQSFTMKILGAPIIKQTQYAKMGKKDYIFFILTYFNRIGKSKPDNVMRSLKFLHQ